MGALVIAASPAVADQAASDPVARGKYLVTAGDCVACHTAPGGKPFAGGLAINSPFGVIYTPNITADKETGLGSWSDDDFYKAMHEGVAKGGTNLYPAFPYPWYTRVTRDDVMAIWAYLKTLQPVHAPKHPNSMIFPFNIRTGIVAWNAVYFHPGTFKPDPKVDDTVNRGAYLVEGLGHCGDCHTPKNAAQAPDTSHGYAGGIIDGWYAPNISSDVREGIGAWSNQQLVTYLKTGAAPGKGVVLGPMAQTVQDSLSKLSDDDLNAIAAYLKHAPAETSYVEAKATNGIAVKAGADTYLTYCASCHRADGHGIPGAVPPLADNGAVTARGPENVIRAVLGGLPAQASYGPMPGFRTVLTDQAIADVTNWVRTAWSNAAPESATPEMVARLSDRTHTLLAGTAGGCPALGSAPVEAAVNDPKSGITDLMKQINPTTLLPDVNEIVRKVKQVVPDGQKADIVNGLTAGYCPIVQNAPQQTVDQKRWRLDQFAALVYTQLNANEQE